jgi:tRNA-specific 2-thiouridylase
VGFSIKVLLGMSGGVDSSVCVKLLLDKGYDVTGATLDFLGKENGDAKAAADVFGIPHIVIDAKEEFKTEVLDYFSESIAVCETPNACVECNKKVKFKLLLDCAARHGFDAVATGHYAKSGFEEKYGRYVLKRVKYKDQSYFLYRLTSQQLSKIIFPLADLNKEHVRETAREAGIKVYNKPDSQDLCFFEKGEYDIFLEQLNSKHGNFIDIDGNVIGIHKGLPFYTVGQRKGLGISGREPLYVKSRNLGDNTVTLAADSELYTSHLHVRDVIFTAIPVPEHPLSVSIKIRHSKSEIPGTVHMLTDNTARVEFLNPVRASTPGQSAVFYDGDVVIGGGIISADAV